MHGFWLGKRRSGSISAPRMERPRPASVTEKYVLTCDELRSMMPYASDSSRDIKTAQAVSNIFT